jgi:hypothetical protein
LLPVNITPSLPNVRRSLLCHAHPAPSSITRLPRKNSGYLSNRWYRYEASFTDDGHTYNPKASSRHSWTWIVREGARGGSGEVFFSPCCERVGWDVTESWNGGNDATAS